MTHFSFNSHFAHEPYCLLCAGREHLKKKKETKVKYMTQSASLPSRLNKWHIFMHWLPFTSPDQHSFKALKETLNMKETLYTGLNQ